MKKLLTLAILFGAIAFAIPSVEAAIVGSQPTVQQDRYQRNRQNRRVVRVVTRTRIVRQGFHTFRETIQIRYLPNGRTQTKVISRVRIR